MTLKSAHGAAARSRLETCGFWLAVALALRIALAVALPTLYHPDEVFQSLEPAHRLAFGYGAISWEWRSGIRSYVFPAFLAAIMRATAWMAPGSRGYLPGVETALSLLSLSTVWFGWMWAKQVAGRRAGALAAGACALYFGLAGLAPKALSEAIATYILLPGLYFGVYGQQFGERKRLFAAAFLCVLAASLRVQLAPPVLFALVYFCRPAWRERWLPVAAGAAVPVLAFGVVDSFTWGHPWHSFFAYVRMNIVENRSHLYGVAPWYTYLWVLPVVLVPSCLYWPRGVRRCHFLALFVLIFVLEHSAIAHKEERFLLPVVPLCLTIAAIGMAVDRRGNPISGRDAIWRGALCFLLPSIVMGAGFYYFDREPGAETAMKRLAVASEVCGVGLYSLPWTESGGYAYLHRDVPVIPMLKANELIAKAREFNVLIAPQGEVVLPSAFHQEECSGGVCIDRRPGGCVAPPPVDTFNGYLRLHDE